MRLFLQSPGGLSTSQCYFYDLNSRSPTNIWNGSQHMAIERFIPLIVSMGDKVCVI
jgi:hypothetical protein